MNYKDKLILRHMNPIGLVIRCLTYIGLGIALWYHRIPIIIVLVMIDILNWFFMPVADPDKVPVFIKKIVYKEIEWLKTKWTYKKRASVIIGILILVGLTYGLWSHNWYVLSFALIFLSILKQFILKSN